MYGLLGTLHNAEGDADGAIALYNKSLELSTTAEGGDILDVAGTLNDLGLVLHDLKRFDEARDHYERSLENYRAVFGPAHPAVAAVMNNLGLLNKVEGHFDEAEALFTESMAIVERTLGPEHPDMALAYNNLAGLLDARDRPDEARLLYAKSLQIMEGRFELIDVMSEREALSYRDSRRTALNRWLVAFDRDEDAALAWSTVLRWKGLVTRRIRARSAASALDDPDARDLLAQLTEARAELSTLVHSQQDEGESRAETIRSLASRQEALERELAAKSRTWAADQATESAGAAEVCAALEPGTALVDFLHYDADGDAYTAFAVVAPACEVHRFELGSAATIDAAIRSWREVLATGALSTRVDTRGVAVTEAIWEPLAPLLAAVERIIVVPDGAVSAVPFAALPLVGGGYLVESHTISYLSDARDLLRTYPGEATGVLAVAGVDFGQSRSPCLQQEYKPLLHTESEVTQVKSLWSRGRYRKESFDLLAGTDAVESSVSEGLSGKRIAHVATHGFFAAEGCGAPGFDSMLLSGLVFSAGGGDGLMTAAEISSIDMRGTELVVLSACETGLGTLAAGEGVLGLQRAFSVAGVESLVLSLWSVPDEGTAALMAQFYAGLLRRRAALSPVDALRQAQLQLLDRNREQFGEAKPSEWAAFVVTGRPGPE